MNILTLKNESWSVSPCIIFKGAFICAWSRGKEMKAGCSLLTINQLSKTILLQSCSASLIRPLEYCPSVDENWSNMTSPALICRYSDVGKLMPKTKSGWISPLSLHEFDISYTFFLFFLQNKPMQQLFSMFIQWVYWSCVHSMLLSYWAGNLTTSPVLIFMLCSKYYESGIVAITNKGVVLWDVYYRNKYWVLNTQDTNTLYSHHAKAHIYRLYNEWFWNVRP